MKTFLIYSIVDYLVNSCCNEIDRKFKELCIQPTQILLQPNNYYYKIKSKHTYTNCYVEKEILAPDGSLYGYIITHNHNVINDTFNVINDPFEVRCLITQFIHVSNIKYASKLDTPKMNHKIGTQIELSR